MPVSTLDSRSASPTLDAEDVLFETPHGTVRWTDDYDLHLTFDGLSWTLSRTQVFDARDAVHTLAHDVYRCETCCRWQVRVPEQPVAILTTDDVLRLDTLLHGAAVMLELDEILSASQIGE